MKTVLLTLFLMLFSYDAIALDTKALFRKVNKSVVMLMSFDENQQPLSIGSGFFISDGRVIATNYHVIEGSYSVKLKMTDGSVVSVNTLLGVDIDHDIALLEVSKIGQPLKLSQRTPEVGEDIIVIGNPQGLEGTLSKGIVSGVREAEGSLYYQITAPISPGSSGGPIIGQEGEVLGLASFYVQGGQNLNFAMPAAYIHRLLRSPKRQTLTTVTTKKESVVKETVDERVRVVKAYIDGSTPGTLQASILNGTDSIISNVKIVAAFYDQDTPVHYMLVNIPDKIPPGLAKRFQRGDSALHYHGHGIYNQKGKWTAKFRVLDYDIDATSGNVSMPSFN